MKVPRLVEAGGTFVPAHAIYPSQREKFAETRYVHAGRFTARQSSIIDALRQGKPNKQIAFELGMCGGTVKLHLRNVMRILKAKNRTEVALLTGRPGLLPNDR